jgi:hypothetical protein
MNAPAVTRHSGIGRYSPLRSSSSTQTKSKTQGVLEEANSHVG